MTREDKLLRCVEEMIDEHGLSNVIASLYEVVEAKADHLEENWQDYKSAEAYHKVGDAIFKASSLSYDKGL